MRLFSDASLIGSIRSVDDNIYDEIGIESRNYYFLLKQVIPGKLGLFSTKPPETRQKPRNAEEMGYPIFQVFRRS